MLTARERAKRRQDRCYFKVVSTTKAEYFVTIRKTNKYMYLTLNDLKASKVIFSMSSRKISQNPPNIDIAFQFGELFGKEIKGLFKTLPRIVFDRSGYLYHGRVKNAADGIRKSGIQF